MICFSQEVIRYGIIIFSAKRFNDYFLRFASPEKRVFLAASFGNDAIPEEWKERYTQWLDGFLRLSVREKAGAKIIKELIGKDATVLVDPVMMLNEEEWLSVSKKPRVDCTKPYVLKYFLGTEEESSRVDAWANRNGYRVYTLADPKFCELYSSGPGEFIQLVKNAALVFSDSFHCIAFSILFSRPFVVYKRHLEGNDKIPYLKSFAYRIDGTMFCVRMSICYVITLTHTRF